MARGGGPIANNNKNAPAQLNRVWAEDSSSPFFLHNGDHPGLSLVPTQLTGSGSNYNTWNRAMVMALTAKNKLGFVDESLLYMTTCRKVWVDLHDRFHQSNAPRIYQIKKLLSSLHQGSMDISAYYTKLRILWDEFKDYQPTSTCQCGSMKDWINFHNQERVMQFLMGLNDSYAAIRAQVLMIDPLPVMSKVFSLVVQEERQRSIYPAAPSKVTDPPFSLVVSGAVGNVRKFPTFKGKIGGLLCSHCGFTNHTVDRCYKLHGFPSGHPKYTHKQVSGQPRDPQNYVASTTGASSCTSIDSFCQQIIEVLSSKFPVRNVSPMDHQQQEPTMSCFNGIHSLSHLFHVIKRSDLVIDTGATHHICCSMSLFITYRPFVSKVVLPNNFSIQVSHNGTIHLSNDLILHDVLYVPQFHFNLLSISCLTKLLPCSVIFVSDFCEIQDIQKNQPRCTHSRSLVTAPHHLKDYHCYTVTSALPSSTIHRLTSYLYSTKLSSSYRAYVHSISSIIEPEHYSQVVAFPEWRHVMSEELKALELNVTWSIVSLPLGKSVVGCRWVYKTKFSADGSLQCYKARLVLKDILNKRALIISKLFLQSPS
ncbi:uncharacterized protein [Henckelia pumila]|uniref:uncharacterized protein n=1 Tax=Henckelia pumila TaxID=405737 RepID=UPI003C6DF3DB